MRRRSWPLLVLGLVVLSVAGLVLRDPSSDDGSSTPSTVPTTAPVAAELVLEPDGLGGLAFGAGRDDVVRTLGEPTELADVEECPFGPAAVANYPDGLSVTFEDDRFVGWSVRGPSTLTDAAGIGAGSTLAEVRDAHAPVTVEETSLGWELTGPGFYGVLDGPDPDDELVHVFGGRNCIFR